MGIIYALISTIMFSLGSVVAKKLGPSASNVFNLGFYAFPIGFLCAVPCILFSVIKEKENFFTNLLAVGKNKKSCLLLFVRATLGTLVVFASVTSFQYISVADSRTISSASVITVNIFSYLCLRKKGGVVLITVAFLALCGVGIMTRPPILTRTDSFDRKYLVCNFFRNCCLIK